MSQSEKTRKFIEKAMKVHGDRYDYSKVEYKKAIIKVDIVCKEHGVFSQSPNGHLSGRGCHVCGGKKTWDTKSFIINARRVHGDKYDYSHTKWERSNKKVKIICLDHGFFKQESNSHLSGRGCPVCAKEKHGGWNIKTTETFKIQAAKVHGDKYDFSKTKYKKDIIPVIVICSKHGEFSISPNRLLRGCGCQKCGRESSSSKQAHTINEFRANAKEVHGDRYNYSLVEYKTARKKVKIVCKDHGIFLQSPDVHIRVGSGCPRCAEENKKKNAIGWGVTGWERCGKKSKYFTGFKVYLIVCFGDIKPFLKVGRTYRDMGQRFKSKRDMPYRHDTISLIEGSAKEIFELEKEVFKIPKLKRYQPKKEFGGKHECIDISELDRLKKWFEKKKKARLQSSNKQESQLRLF